jgi:cell volume regulation protein A
MSLAFAALAYGIADEAHGSGFLAVYITGLAIGSSPLPGQRTIATFHDGLGLGCSADAVPSPRPARGP